MLKRYSNSSKEFMRNSLAMRKRLRYPTRLRDSPSLKASKKSRKLLKWKTSWLKTCFVVLMKTWQRIDKLKTNAIKMKFCWMIHKIHVVTRPWRAEIQCGPAIQSHPKPRMLVPCVLQTSTGTQPACRSASRAASGSRASPTTGSHAAASRPAESSRWQWSKQSVQESGNSERE